jgi:hypothetical protein
MKPFIGRKQECIHFEMLSLILEQEKGKGMKICYLACVSVEVLCHEFVFVNVFFCQNGNKTK